MSGDTYTHGHQESVVGQHRRRTAESCAAYLLPHLGIGDDVLDVGCGPGSITVGLGAAVPDGSVIGMEVAPDVLEGARQLAAESGATNVVFEVGDVYQLTYADDRFDATHAHQVLQHLTRPVDALREMARVTKPGGFVAVRDVDYATFVHAPHEPALDRWLELYHAVAHHNGADPDAGRHLLRWCHEAGLNRVEITSDTWTMADEDSRLNWGDSWAERTLESALGRQALEYGLASRSDLEEMSDAWRRWARNDDSVFYMVHVAALATV